VFQTNLRFRSADLQKNTQKVINKKMEDDDDSLLCHETYEVLPLQCLPQPQPRPQPQPQPQPQQPTLFFTPIADGTAAATAAAQAPAPLTPVSEEDKHQTATTLVTVTDDNAADDELMLRLRREDIFRTGIFPHSHPLAKYYSEFLYILERACDRLDPDSNDEKKPGQQEDDQEFLASYPLRVTIVQTAWRLFLCLWCCPTNKYVLSGNSVVPNLAVALHTSVLQHDRITRYSQLLPDLSDDIRSKCRMNPLIERSVDVCNTICKIMYEIVEESTDKTGKSEKTQPNKRCLFVTHSFTLEFYTALNWSLRGPHSIADWVLWFATDLVAHCQFQLREEDVHLCLKMSTHVVNSPQHIHQRASTWALLLIMTCFYTNSCYDRDHDVVNAYIDNVLDVFRLSVVDVNDVILYLMEWFANMRISTIQQKQNKL